ncbi:hypothetical protein FRP1_29550 (plasmid) [Pseudonocardia sp. EC080625-04]|uniref:condensation domain-containing protein n=1 Tax=unclassified Pseudonocardia TaxID=2619320 RepID=UPI0006CB80AA|nr:MULTISPECIES: condensation domain-containing protein [unclassified Pseudonocardia]ALE76903.1 hypothetical protein FRP1_29550 [Pseudonocardia sp. EC080625-04]ALL85885.1 hypothetical protein AD017_32755 [Pseudonocardia sp. EC080619-01]
MSAPSAKSEVVRFVGETVAIAPMTWSQFGMWDAIKKFRPYDTYLNVSFRVKVPDGRTLDEVMTAVRDMVVRHEGLRTLYYDSPNGTATQEVVGAGEVEVRFEYPTETTAGSLDEMVMHLADRSFDVASELPCRFAVVHVEGRPCWLLAVVSHLSIDGLARNRLVEEFTAQLAGDDHRDGEREVLTPVERALSETSPDGVRKNDRAIARWRRFVETNEVTNFSRQLHGEREPRWLRAVMFSPALGFAFDRVAARNNVTSPAVYVALSAVMVSTLSERSTTVLRCMVSNRYTDAEKRYIGNLSQACAFDVEVAGSDFDTIVQRAMSASIRGYSMGCYRVDEMEQLVDPSLFDAMHNDFRDAAAASRPEELLSEPEIYALTSRTVVDPPQSLRYYDDKFHVEVRGGLGGPAPAVMIDRCFLPFSEPRKILLAMEAFALSVISDSGHRSAVDLFRAALADPAGPTDRKESE